MSKKRIVLLVFIILLLCFFVLFFYYTFASYDDSVDKGYVDIENPVTTVKITSPLSLNDETGRKIESNKDGVNIYYEIKIKSNVEKKSRYKILINPANVGNKIGNSYIKVLLTDKDNKIIKSYDRESYPTLDKLHMFKSSYILHEGKLKGLESDKFILRMWVSDFYVVKNKDGVFKADISVYSY